MGRYNTNAAAACLTQLHKAQGEPLTANQLIKRTHRQSATVYATLKQMRTDGIVAAEKPKANMPYEYTADITDLVRFVQQIAKA